MKKVIFLSACSLLLVTACKKNEGPKEFCVECTQTTTITSNSEVFNDLEPSVWTFERCGITTDALDYMLQTGNVSSTNTHGGITTIETTCTKN